jgi:hypothetical protein
MVLLGDAAQVDAHFDPSDIVLILMQIGAQHALNIPQAQKSFWTQPIELLGDKGHVQSHFNPFGDGVSISAR